MKQLEYDDMFGNFTNLEIEPNLQRFGIGLFNQTHTYGNHTDKARAVRDIFHDDDLFCFVVKGPYLDDIINEFRVSMDNTPSFHSLGSSEISSISRLFSMETIRRRKNVQRSGQKRISLSAMMITTRSSWGMSSDSKEKQV